MGNENEAASLGSLRPYILSMLLGLGLGGGGGSMLSTMGNGSDEETQIVLIEERLRNTTKQIENIEIEMVHLETHTEHAIVKLSEEVVALREGLNQLLLKEGLEPVRPRGR